MEGWTLGSSLLSFCLDNSIRRILFAQRLLLFELRSGTPEVFFVVADRNARAAIGCTVIREVAAGPIDGNKIGCVRCDNDVSRVQNRAILVENHEIGRAECLAADEQQLAAMNGDIGDVGIPDHDTSCFPAQAKRFGLAAFNSKLPGKGWRSGEQRGGAGETELADQFH